jgi:hypothetical protein
MGGFARHPKVLAMIGNVLFWTLFDSASSGVVKLELERHTTTFPDDRTDDCACGADDAVFNSRSEKYVQMIAERNCPG